VCHLPAAPGGPEGAFRGCVPHAAGSREPLGSGPAEEQPRAVRAAPVAAPIAEHLCSHASGTGSSGLGGGNCFSVWLRPGVLRIALAIQVYVLRHLCERTSARSLSNFSAGRLRGELRCHQQIQKCEQSYRAGVVILGMGSCVDEGASRRPGKLDGRTSQQKLKKRNVIRKGREKELLKCCA